MTDTNRISRLTYLAILNISGKDAEKFLHGQFTSNIKGQQQGQFSAWCNPKGQTKASFFIYPYDDRFNILLPSTLKVAFMKALQMYILRDDVTLTDQSDKLECIGLCSANPPPQLAHINKLKKIGDLSIQERLHCMRIAATSIPRYLLVSDKANNTWTTLRQHVNTISNNIWQLQDIQAKYPWITTATSEKFLPQMLNLDHIGGLDYQKGCYPGQEIITRLHFRGQLKRSLQLATCSLSGKPGNGDPINNGKADIGTIINIQATSEQYQMLSVIDHAAIEQKLQLQDGTAIHLKVDTN